MRVTVKTVLTGLKQDDPILVMFDSQGYITSALETIWTVIVIARKIGRRVVAGAVNLQWNNKKGIEIQICASAVTKRNMHLLV